MFDIWTPVKIGLWDIALDYYCSSTISSNDALTTDGLGQSTSTTGARTRLTSSGGSTRAITGRSSRSRPSPTMQLTFSSSTRHPTPLLSILADDVQETLEVMIIPLLASWTVPLRSVPTPF